jgi:hypothetical protein
MRKLRFRSILLVAASCIVVQSSWIAIRVSNNIAEEAAYFNEPSMDAVYVISGKHGLILKANDKAISLCDIQSALSSEQLTDDFDEDGLNLEDELIRLTSDLRQDSDFDGFPDSIDSSPNEDSKRSTVLGSLLNLVLTEHVEALGYSEMSQVLVHRRLSFSGCFSSPDSGFTMVCATDFEMAFLKTRGQNPTFRVEQILSLPGLVYVVFSCHSGAHGYDGRYFIVWDVPFYGPCLVSTIRP